MSEKRKLTEDEKEQQFKAKMDELDNKAKDRRKRREEKLRKRADYLSNHPVARYSWITLKVIICCLIIGFLYFMATVSLKLYDNYNNSVKWTKISGLKLADQQPDLLYSDDKDKKVKLELSELMKEIWDYDKHQFNAGVTNEKIDKMKSLYDKAKEPKDNLGKEYNEIMTFWDARSTLLNIFTNDSFDTLKKSVTIQQMSDTVDTVFDKIDDYLVKGDNYTQANIYRDLTYALANDANTYSSIITNFNKLFNITKNENRLRIKTDMVNKDYDSLSTDINMLSYKYEMIENFVNPIMKASKTSVQKNTKNKSDYAEYETDLNAKNNFSTYYDSYINTMNLLKSSVVDYVNFEGKNISELQKWASENNIKLKTTEQNSDKTVGTILSQTPSVNKYTKIVKGSSIDVVVAKKNVASYNTSDSTTGSTYQSGSRSSQSTSRTESGSRNNSSNTSQSSSRNNSTNRD